MTSLTEKPLSLITTSGFVTTNKDLTENSLQHPVHPSSSAHFYYYYLPRVPSQCLTTAISTSLPAFVSWPCSCDLTRRNAWVAGNCTECPRIFLTHSHNTLASWNSDRIVCSWSPGEKRTPFFFSLSLPTCAERQDWPASIHPSPTCSVWKIHYLVVRLLDWSVLFPPSPVCLSAAVTRGNKSSTINSQLTSAGQG